MTCIKTGARVWLPDYNLIAPADLYAVGDSIIVRFNGDPTKYEGNFHLAGSVPEGATHIVHLNFRGENYIRLDTGTLVVERRAIDIAPRGDEA